MKYLRDSDPRFQHLGLKVGSFLAVLAGVLVLLAAVVAWRQDFFEPVDDFHADPGRADGLTPGMDVTLHGIRIGRVRALWLAEDGTPRLTLRVRREGSAWLRADAVAVLTGRGPLETPYINLRPGSDSRPLAPGSDIHFEREASIGEMTTALEQQLRPIIAAGGRLLEDLNSPSGEVRRSLASLQSLTADLAREVPLTLGDARGVIRSTQVFVDGLSAPDGDVAGMRRHLLSMASEIDQRLPRLLQETTESVASLRRTVAQLEKTTRASAPQIEELAERSNGIARRTESLIADLRNVWMLRLMLPKERNAEAAVQPTPSPRR